MDSVQAMEEQLLAELASNTVKMEPVNDVIEIDAESRTIIVPSTELLFGVVTDTDVERKYFRAPRIVGDAIDLSNLSLRIHFENANKEKDKYIVDDLQIDGDCITFSWLLSDKILRYSGTVCFTICAVRVNSDETVSNCWNTTLATGTVLNGLEVDDLSYIEESEARDVLAQLLDIMDTKSNETVQAVTNEGITQIASIQTKSDEQIAAIEAKGVATLETIPEDYTTTNNLAESNSRHKASVITQVASGEHTTFNDSAQMPFQGLKLYGKSKQVSTTGAQLLDFDPYVSFAATLTYANANANMNPFSKGGGTYSYTCSGAIGNSYKIWAYDESDNLIVNANTGIITLTEEEANSIVRVTIVMQGVTPGMNYAGYIYPMINYGETPLPYEPYTGGIASPSPSYPQEITHLHTNEQIVTTIIGKNVLRETAISAKTTNNGIISEYEGNGIFHIYGTFNGTSNGIQLSTTWFKIPIEPDEIYTLSVKLLSGTVPDDFHPYVGVGSDTVDFRNWFSLTIDQNTEVGTTVTNIGKGKDSLSDACYMHRFWIYAHNDTLEAYTADFRIQVWIEKGSTSTPYEPYTEQQLVYDISEGLPGIPVSAGGNYTDVDGQQWYCDEIDFDRGVYIQRCFTETLEFTPQTELSRYSATLTHTANVNCAQGNGIPVLCTEYAFNELCGSGSPMVNGIRIAATSPKYVIAYNNGEVIESATIMYPLAEPIETPLSDDMILAYKALHTNYPITTVFNDSKAHMNVSYAADTKTYIDNKFAELEAKISSSS